MYQASASTQPCRSAREQGTAALLKSLPLRTWLLFQTWCLSWILKQPLSIWALLLFFFYLFFCRGLCCAGPAVTRGLLTDLRPQ